jgi:hypothetical protein
MCREIVAQRRWSYIFQVWVWVEVGAGVVGVASLSNLVFSRSEPLTWALFHGACQPDNESPNIPLKESTS